MNANRDLERRVADFYESEAPPRAPDWVLRSALQTIDTTRQRRVVIRVPWRFPQMNTFAKVAVAAVVVIAVGALGLSLLRPPSSSNVGGQPSASASPSPSISFGPSPSVSFASPPPLTETFTSQRHGISIAYPTGWTTAPATEPWTGGGLSFGSSDVDYIYDSGLTSDLFIALASQPLDGKTGETWATDFLADPESDCAAGESGPTTVDGSNGLLCGHHVALSAGDRGYFIRLYTSDAVMDSSYDDAWFRSLLATVQLRPEDAVDTAPSPSP